LAFGVWQNGVMFVRSLQQIWSPLQQAAPQHPNAFAHAAASVVQGCATHLPLSQ
jgi:hypothetical protein